VSDGNGNPFAQQSEARDWSE